MVWFPKCSLTVLTSEMPSHWTWFWIHSSRSEFSFSRTPSLTCVHSSSAFSRASCRCPWSAWDSGVLSRIWSIQTETSARTHTHTQTYICSYACHTTGDCLIWYMTHWGVPSPEAQSQSQWGWVPTVGLVSAIATGLWAATGPAADGCAGLAVCPQG